MSGNVSSVRRPRWLAVTASARSPAAAATSSGSTHALVRTESHAPNTTAQPARVTAAAPCSRPAITTPPASAATNSDPPTPTIPERSARSASTPATSRATTTDRGLSRSDSPGIGRLGAAEPADSVGAVTGRRAPARAARAASGRRWSGRGVGPPCGTRGRRRDRRRPGSSRRAGRRSTGRWPGRGRRRRRHGSGRGRGGGTARTPGGGPRPGCRDRGRSRPAPRPRRRGSSPRRRPARAGGE